MKRTGKIVLASVSLLAANFAAWACISGSCGAGAAPGAWMVEAAAPQEAGTSVREPSPLLFAEKRDEGDHILYRTDEEPGKSHEELQREEEEKEERSWQMLESTVIVPERDGRRRPPHRGP